MNKTIRNLCLFAALAAMATLPSACATASKKSATIHEREIRAVAVPPGWQVVTPAESLTLPASQTVEFANGTAVVTTNHVGLFSPRPRIFVAIRETWSDTARGGGTFLFTDPQASQIASQVGNQAALGGTHAFTVGNVSSTITSNAVAAITASGNAAGNVIGTAAKAATGKP